MLYCQDKSETSETDKTVAGVPALHESFVKSSDNHVKDGDVTTNKTDDFSDTNNDDIVKHKDVISDMSIDADNILTKECDNFLNDTNDKSELKKENDDVMKNTDDVTKDEVELEDKLNTCKEQKTNHDLSTDLADRLHLKVKQDLRKLKTTVEFVEEDVQDMKGCEDEWDVNNSESEEDENWEQEEDTGDNDVDNDIGDNFGKSIGDDCSNDIGDDDHIDEDIGDNSNIDSDIGDDVRNNDDSIDNDNDDICVDGKHIGCGIDDRYNDKEDENSKRNFKNAVEDSGSKVAPKKKLSKGV